MILNLINFIIFVIYRINEYCSTVKQNQNDKLKKYSVQYLKQFHIQFGIAIVIFKFIKIREQLSISQQHSSNNQLQQLQQKVRITQKDHMQKDDEYLVVDNNNNRNKIQPHKYNTQIQPKSYEEKLQESIFMGQSDVEEGTSNESFGMMPNIDIGNSQSYIMESISFASGHKIESVIHCLKQQSFNLNKVDNNQKIHSFAKKGAFHQYKIDNVTTKIRQLQQMVQQLKITQKQMVKELMCCYSTGKSPLFIGNKNVQGKLLVQIQQVFNSNFNKFLQKKQTNNSRNSLSKVLNTSVQHEVLDSSFRQLNNGKMIQKMIKDLQQKQSYIQQLQDRLNDNQMQAIQKQTILTNKIQIIKQLQEKIFKYKDIAQNAESHTNFQNAGTFSPQIQKILRQKQIKNLELSREISLIKEKNQQQICQKECLQQQIFTLQQKIIGVQMEIQQKVKRGIQQIYSTLQENTRKQYQLKFTQKQRQNLERNQCYLQTIDTLSKQVADMTNKCKSYQNYICDQQSKKSTNSSDNSPQNRQYEVKANKKMAEMQVKLNQMAVKQNGLHLRNKKIENFQLNLKDFQLKLDTEATKIQKQQQILIIKQEQLEKYLHELNEKEKDLYNWQIKLNSQQQFLDRNISQLQRLQNLHNNQKSYGNSMISPYPVSQVIQRTDAISPQLNSFPNVSPGINNRQAYNLAIGPGVCFDTVDRLNQMTQMYYEPTYQQRREVNSTKKYSKTFNHYPVTIEGRYERQQSKGDSMQQQHNPKYYRKSNDLRSRFNNQNTQFQSSYQHQISLRNKTSSMRKKLGYNQNDNQDPTGKDFSYHQNYINQRSKFYSSTIQDKKSQVVEQILSKRRNDKLDQKITHKNTKNQMLSKSQLKEIKYPIVQRSNNSRQGLKQRIRQHKQRFQSRKVYSKGFSQINKPTTKTNGSAYIAKKSALQINRDPSEFRDKSNRSKSFQMSNLPCANNINQKLQRLKEQIKRQVKALNETQ